MDVVNDFLVYGAHTHTHTPDDKDKVRRQWRRWQQQYILLFFVAYMLLRLSHIIYSTYHSACSSHSIFWWLRKRIYHRRAKIGIAVIFRAPIFLFLPFLIYCFAKGSKNENPFWYLTLRYCVYFSRIVYIYARHRVSGIPFTLFPLPKFVHPNGWENVYWKSINRFIVTYTTYGSRPYEFI